MKASAARSRSTRQLALAVVTAAALVLSPVVAATATGRAGATVADGPAVATTTAPTTVHHDGVYGW